MCRHIDGMAIGSTMAALESRGVLRTIAGADQVAFGKLRDSLGANAGFLHVAVRLLADQGWVSCAGEGGTDQLIITPTAAGRLVMGELAGGYAEAVRFLPLAARPDITEDDKALAPFARLAEREWNLPATPSPSASASPSPSPCDAATDARHQVLAHLNGHLFAPLMFVMTRPGRDLTETAGRILALAGWTRDGRFTPDGEIALTLARQYRYPMVYLPLLRSVPELIFGAAPSSSVAAEETHLDRDLDIRFSGEVFAALCRTPFLEIALPLFEAEPGAQPALVVDTGCGDGTLLETLYAAVRDRTARGRRLGEHPLLMVGADPSPVARRTASARLAAVGVPHLILDGDIADPDGLARELAAAGHDATDALHVCKSAIHDRAYTLPTAPPGAAHSSASVHLSASAHRPGSAHLSGAAHSSASAHLSGATPVTATAFAHPDGEAIPATLMAANLAALFRDWRPLTRRHGWIVIEAHSTPAATVARLAGRTIATALDATHGYSCQYPVEPEVYAWAVGTAGFASRAHHEPGAATLGHTQLTIDHFVTEG